MKTSSAVLSHGAICFSAFHTHKKWTFCEMLAFGHFWLLKGEKSLWAAQCSWYRISKTQFYSYTKLCIIEAIKLHLLFWFQDGEANCSNITCQPLNCTEAPILLPHSCCPVCPGKRLIFCYAKVLAPSQTQLEVQHCRATGRQLIMVRLRKYFAHFVSRN